MPEWFTYATWFVAGFTLAFCLVCWIYSSVVLELKRQVTFWKSFSRLGAEADALAWEGKIRHHMGEGL